MIKRIGSIKVVHFEAWHLDWISFTVIAQSSLDTYVQNQSAHGKILEELGSSYTALCEGRVVASGGIIHGFKGTGDLWLFLGKNTFDQKRIALRFFKFFLDEIQSKHELHRIQAVVKSDFEEGHRFAQFFGFENEGVMRQYGPDRENFHRYAKCWNGK